jgi:capsular exopolysaccharide synthesis family protein
MLREEMKQLNDALTSVRTRREEIAARRNQLLKVGTDDPGNLPDSELLHSALLQQLRQRYVESVRERDGLLAGGKGERHPDVLAATARADASRSALFNEVKSIQGAVQHDLAVVEQQEVGLSALFEKAKTQALQLNLLEIEYNRLHRTKENNEKLYDLILQRTKESDLARMMHVNNVRVVDAALLPRTPVRPRVPVDLGLGGALGLLLGVAATTARALLDRTVKTPADVEQDLELPFLGLMPLIAPTPQTSKSRKRRRSTPMNADLIVHHSPRSGAAEAARTIRTNLMFMAPDHPYRTLLVTSAGPSEGKTTVACCIATAMAQAGQRVLLIDCDLRRPRIHRVFDRTLETGLTSVLINDSALTAAVTHTVIDNLDVLPAGPLPPNPAELLQSERFKTLLALLSTRYDRIVLDSAPAAAVTDPAVLARIVDGAVLVVRAYHTTKDLARHGLRSLLSVGGHVAGIVLNAVDLDRHEYKYYHYYYAKPGYTYGDAKPDTTDAAPPIQ